jgi:hypothetical protein
MLGYIGAYTYIPQHFSNLVHSTHTYLPMKMEQTECSETSAFKIQTPWYYPEESIQHSEHGESLKSRILDMTFTVSLAPLSFSEYYPFSDCFFLKMEPLWSSEKLRIFYRKTHCYFPEDLSTLIQATIVSFNILFNLSFAN